MTTTDKADKTKDKTEAKKERRSLWNLWQKLYDAQEQALSSTFERLGNTQAFSEASGKMLESVLSAQKLVRENMRSYLETINVPTREDIARLGELIIGMEEKIDQLDERLERIEALLERQMTREEKP